MSGLAAQFEAAAGHLLGGRWWSHYESWLYSRRAAGARAAAKPGKLTADVAVGPGNI